MQIWIRFGACSWEPRPLDPKWILHGPQSSNCSILYSVEEPLAHPLRHWWFLKYWGTSKMCPYFWRWNLKRIPDQKCRLLKIPHYYHFLLYMIETETTRNRNVVAKLPLFTRHSISLNIFQSNYKQTVTSCNYHLILVIFWKFWNDILEIFYGFTYTAKIGSFY